MLSKKDDNGIVTHSCDLCGNSLGAAKINHLPEHWKATNICLACKKELKELIKLKRALK